MINKKELEIELAKKRADALSSAFEISEKSERKIFELEKRIAELETIVKLHSDDLKHVGGCLESNEGIMRMLDERIDELEGKFAKHVD